MTRKAVMVLAIGLVGITGCCFDETAKRKRCGPQLITEQDGVKLFRVCKPGTCGFWSTDYVFFTTRGDVSWDERRSCGKNCSTTDHYSTMEGE